MTTSELYEESSQEQTWEESAEAGDIDLLTVDPDLIDMWKTTCCFSEQMLTDEPTDAQRARWAFLKNHFEKHPREYYVADCEHCDWFMGGWLTSAKATKVLNKHIERSH